MSFFPPQMRHEVMSVKEDSLVNTMNICVANSLVGVTTTTLIAAISFGRYNNLSKNGNTKAAVFPMINILL